MPKFSPTHPNTISHLKKMNIQKQVSGTHDPTVTQHISYEKMHLCVHILFFVMCLMDKDVILIHEYFSRELVNATYK